MTVVINSPTSGTTLSGTVNVTATFTGTRFDIATVTLSGTQLASDSALPLSFQIDTTKVADGNHTLTVAVRHYKGSGQTKKWQKASIPVVVENSVVSPPPTSKPAIPTGFTAVLSNDDVILSWNASPSNEQVDGYQIYVDDQNHDLDVDALTYTVTGLLAGTTHTFRVSAHNASGYGDWTSALSLTIPGGSTPPSSSDYTYRFATFNPSTDKVTGCLNRFQPSYSWWVPGGASGTPWPQGGGIYPVNHATHGPGLELRLTDEMLYGNVAAGTGPKDSNVVRFVGESNKIDERLRVPAAGSIHTWECTIMRPAGTWPSGPYECVWEQGTDNGYGQNVGHHIFLNNNAHFPGFTYYFGRQTGSGPLGGTYWQRYNAPVPFNAGEYHTIRWEFKWTAPGVANGYLKTWIGVNGAPLTPWLDLQNIATQVAGFKQHYTHMVTIRTPRNVMDHPALSLHIYNMKVKIT